jgi:phosphate-selective porin OprO/OprP
VPQGYFYSGPLGVLAEYALSWQEVRRAEALAELEHTAWQVTASFFVTGEKASYKSVTPERAFDLEEAPGFGAVELAARYGESSLDGAAFPTFANPASAARKARAWAVGANWYLAKGVKVVVDYEHTTFAGGAATGDREPEDFLVSRIQYAF